MSHRRSHREGHLRSMGSFRQRVIHTIESKGRRGLEGSNCNKCSAIFAIQAKLKLKRCIIKIQDSSGCILDGGTVTPAELQIVAAPGHLVPSRFRDQQQDLEGISRTFCREQEFEGKSSTLRIFLYIIGFILIIFGLIQKFNV